MCLISAWVTSSSFRGPETEPLRVRLVATLANSLFQGELLMGDENFRRLFPEEQGFRFFLMDAPCENVSSVTEILEQRLGDFGFDVVSTHERIADFHRVENTYLSTFQSLGGLGLILGTFGVAVVMLRNILERRGELALLRAVGYDSGHFAWMVIAENALLLLGGVLTGTVCAIVAIAPALASRGEGFSIPSVSSRGKEGGFKPWLVASRAIRDNKEGVERFGQNSPRRRSERGILMARFPAPREEESLFVVSMKLIH